MDEPEAVFTTNEWYHCGLNGDALYLVTYKDGELWALECLEFYPSWSIV